MTRLTTTCSVEHPSRSPVDPGPRDVQRTRVHWVARSLAARASLPPLTGVSPDGDVLPQILADLSRAERSEHADVLREVSEERGVEIDELARRAQLTLASLLLPASGTFYEILGVPPHASTREIRRHWAAAIRRYHPDRFGGQNPWLDAQAQRLIEAYETLRVRSGADATTPSSGGRGWSAPRLPRGADGSRGADAGGGSDDRRHRAGAARPGRDRASQLGPDPLPPAPLPPAPKLLEKWLAPAPDWSASDRPEPRPEPRKVRPLEPEPPRRERPTGSASPQPDPEGPQRARRRAGSPDRRAPRAGAAVPQVLAGHSIRGVARTLQPRELSVHAQRGTQHGRGESPDPGIRAREPGSVRALPGFRHRLLHVAGRRGSISGRSWSAAAARGLAHPVGDTRHRSRLGDLAPRRPGAAGHAGRLSRRRLPLGRQPRLGRMAGERTDPGGIRSGTVGARLGGGMPPWPPRS